MATTEGEKDDETGDVSFPAVRLNKRKVAIDEDEWKRENGRDEENGDELQFSLPGEYQLVHTPASSKQNRSWSVRQLHTYLSNKLLFTDGQQATSLISAYDLHQALWYYTVPGSVGDEYRKHRCTVTVVVDKAHGDNSRNQTTGDGSDGGEHIRFSTYAKNKHGAFVAVGALLSFLMQCTDTKFESIRIAGCNEKETLPIPAFVLQDFCKIQGRVDCIQIYNGKLTPDHCRALVGADACAAKSLVLHRVFIDPAFFGEICQNKHYHSIDLGEMSNTVRQHLLEEIEIQTEMRQFPGYEPPQPPPTVFNSINTSVVNLSMDGPHLKFGRAFGNVRNFRFYRPYDLVAGDYERVAWRRLSTLGPLVSFEMLHSFKTREWSALSSNLSRSLEKVALKFAGSLSYSFGDDFGYDCPGLTECRAELRDCNVDSWQYFWTGLAGLRDLNIAQVSSINFEMFEEMSDDEDVGDGDDEVDKDDKIAMAPISDLVAARAALQELHVTLLTTRSSATDLMKSSKTMKEVQKRLAVRRAVRQSPLLLARTPSPTATASSNTAPKTNASTTTSTNSMVRAMLLRSILNVKKDSNNESAADSLYRLLTANTDCVRRPRILVVITWILADSPTLVKVVC